ncbi:hypothetical protein DFH06DRAFT_1341797 [Mycena polygramma]|nr:hypothetical protein DFH06DRAFT_1341797 [Mycena polygramma]
MTRTYDSAQHLLSLQRPGLLTPDLESNPYDFSSSRFDHYREPNGHHHQRCHYCPASVNPKPAPTSASASTSNSHATAANGATSNTVTAQAQPKRRAAPPVVPRPPSIVPRTTLSIGLTLASMLPPLATLRRPSKAAIVRTSIATVNASRRHCVLAAQTLRALEGGGEFEGRESLLSFFSFVLPLFLFLFVLVLVSRWRRLSQSAGVCDDVTPLRCAPEHFPTGALRFEPGLYGGDWTSKGRPRSLRGCFALPAAWVSSSSVGVAASMEYRLRLCARLIAPRTQSSARTFETSTPYTSLFLEVTSWLHFTILTSSLIVSTRFPTLFLLLLLTILPLSRNSTNAARRRASCTPTPAHATFFRAEVKDFDFVLLEDGLELEA